MDKKGLKELLKETKRGETEWITNTDDFWEKGLKEHPYITVFKGAQLKLFGNDGFVHLQIFKGRTMKELKEKSFISLGKDRLIRKIFFYLFRKDYKEFRALKII